MIMPTEISELIYNLEDIAKTDDDNNQVKVAKRAIRIIKELYKPDDKAEI